MGNCLDWTEACDLEVGCSPVERLFLLLNTTLELLGAQRQHLGLLHELLVRRVSLNSHHNCALLRVDLGVEFCIPVDYFFQSTFFNQLMNS